MKCPHCDIELKPKLNVDECDNCKGIWFEKDELRQAKDIKDPDLNWMDFEIWKHEDKFKAKTKELPCPQCNQSLMAIDYNNSDVEIDYCPECKGIWLDKDEFEKIINALTNELLSKSFSGYIKASLEEAKEIITGPESLLSEWKDFSTVLRMMQYRLFTGNPPLLDNIRNLQKISPIR